MSRPVDVVVAGAGPAGLTVGHALSEAGYRVVVIEAGRLNRTSKTWLTFGDAAEAHDLGGAAHRWCRRGHLRFYTGDSLTIERRRLVCIFDEVRLLETLATRLLRAGGALRQEESVLGFERETGRRGRLRVATSAGSLCCDLLIDATAGGLDGEVEVRDRCAWYLTYARIYEGCVPRLPLDEVVLLHKGYPRRAAGQWSAPIAEDRYLLGEFDFWPSVTRVEIDLEARRAHLASRLDRYTWEVQDLVDVPRDASYAEFFGAVPLRASPPPARDNVLRIGDSAGQARPFFGISLDQIFEQTAALRTVVDRAFREGDLSGPALARFNPSGEPSKRMNFHLGMAIWQLLHGGPDVLCGRMCSVLDRIDDELKYDLLRTRLDRQQVRAVATHLAKEGFLAQLLRELPLSRLLRLAGSALRSAWYWWRS